MAEPQLPPMRGQKRFRLGASDFLQWISDEDGLYDRFDRLAREVEALASDRILRECSDVGAIARRLGDVIARCDDIDYDDWIIVQAYALLHFLDRYHRFQIILSRLAELRLLPIKMLPIDILDVGTGPGPSLFAVSDFYASLVRYGIAMGDAALAGLRYNSDFVESSHSFLDWLGWFAGFVNLRDSNSSLDWPRPYYVGSFRDFRGLDFQKEKDSLFQRRIARIEREFEEDDQDPPSRDFIIRNLMDDEWKNALRYDLIIFSNFLTRAEQVRNLERELRSAANALRNHGIILVVGASTRKYVEIYSEIREILCGKSYAKKKSISRVSEISIADWKMKYDWRERFGQQMKPVYQLLLKRINDCGVSSAVEANALQFISQRARGEAIPRWGMRVFRKESWPRRRRSLGSTGVRRPEDTIKTAERG
jgi:ribosomal protein RSM22 (predicted rRNA methylase)